MTAGDRLVDFVTFAFAISITRVSYNGNKCTSTAHKPPIYTTARISKAETLETTRLLVVSHMTFRERPSSFHCHPVESKICNPPRFALGQVSAPGGANMLFWEI